MKEKMQEKERAATYHAAVFPPGGSMVSLDLYRNEAYSAASYSLRWRLPLLPFHPHERKAIAHPDQTQQPHSHETYQKKVKQDFTAKTSST